ncbi:MAG: hypothetical protein NZ583_01540 [Desulfobacterota bacterium]|nr:hypothetical protein [Thermodesulfobacteriota bacterium]MDW8001397.1 hypothetical protein [Deltaproteobacteria bacterium]
MEVIKKAMDYLGKDSSYSDTARILGVYLEGPFLNEKRCGALDRRFFLKPDEKKLEEILEGFYDVVKVITVAPELDGAMRLIKLLTKKGIIVSMGHSEATYTEAEEAYKNGARLITHIFNAMKPFHHRNVGIAGFGLLKRDVYVEVIGDLNHLDIKTIELVFRMKKNDRIILVSDSFRGTLKNNKKKKRLEGGDAPLSLCAKRLIEAGFDAELIETCISENPLSMLRTFGRG